MFAIIFLVVFALLANESTALKAESICCEEIKSLVENKTTAHKTVCLENNSRLSSNCCRNIEIEIERNRYAYKTLCSAKEKSRTTPTPTTVITTATTEPPVPQCYNPLGIEYGNISDVAMTSSTVHNSSSLPHFGRLRNQLGNCAWIPATTADRNSSWLQIDLGSMTNVSGVATQGSCTGQRWSKSYVIMYSANDVNWTNYEEMDSTKLFIGNNDSSSVVTNHFKTPFKARFVRISPRSWHQNAALRIELYTDCHSLISLPDSQAPQSCLDHLKNGLKVNGYYNIYDASSNLITVYCDMTSEPGMAWTLVLSVATKNKDMAQFQSTALSIDMPIDENFPNWNKYRMSLTMMTNLSAQSTNWRATCSFPTYGVDYTDYVRGKFISLDIVNYIGLGVCKRVEFVNIRGHQCSNCDLPWWQDTTRYFLHSDSSTARCGFDPRQGGISFEDNFGYYGTVNSKFRCTANPSATTNWWFGGSVV